MAEQTGINIIRIKELREDIVTLSKQPKLAKEVYKELNPEVQKEIKRINANYNQLIKVSLDLVIETKDYSKTTYSWTDEDTSEYEALMEIIGE